LANVFDQIDPINLKDSVKKINESILDQSRRDMHDESKRSIRDHHHHIGHHHHELIINQSANNHYDLERSKENEYQSRSYQSPAQGSMVGSVHERSNDTGNFALYNSNKQEQASRDRGSIGGNANDASVRTKGSQGKSSENMIYPQP